MGDLTGGSLKEGKSAAHCGEGERIAKCDFN